MSADRSGTASLPLPPGQSGLPWIGETISFVTDPDFATKRRQKYGAIFRTHIIGRPTVVMSGAAANKFILSTHFDKFSWRDGWPDNFQELLGASLFLQEGAEHQRNRRLLMPAFHGKALVNYVETMTKITDRYLTRWEQIGDLTWFPELKNLTFEIASILLIGSEPGAETTELSRLFTELTNGLFTIPVRWSYTTYGRALAARDRILEHIDRVVLERQQTPTQDALGLLVQSQDEAGNRLSITELKVQALLLLFAGHETTTSLVASLCLALAQHPEVLAKARAEQVEIGIDTPISIDSLKQMTYLDRVLREVERMYPPIGGGFRGVVEEFEFNGYRVPKGWQVLYRIPEAHFDAAVYPAPDTFNPDRPIDKASDYNFVTYGGGSRICIGMAFAQMELKIIAAMLLRRNSWELLPNQNLTLDPIPTLHPRDGLKVKFQKL
ncbi:cytochrome P450 [Chamaesiphon sp. GL140_3_metabinner_50]|uniref:cytochrome P450 n=1 Tax=Chamaesiphon sp. GL140_3_metabinner_50 TaxID=2970812 RepID=UPI0025EADC6F|nr:cytochrome P450 [Chamaesiphon sp. GL140_3_metabinner_50]